MTPEARSRLIALAGRLYGIPRVAGVTGVTADKGQEHQQFARATLATPATPPCSAPNPNRVSGRPENFGSRSIDSVLIMIEKRVRQLDGASPPSNFPANQWATGIAHTKQLLIECAERALSLGWTIEELFGVHPTAPAARYDAMGLAFALGEGDRVVCISKNSATIEAPTGAMQSFARATTEKGIAIWELCDLHTNDEERSAGFRNAA